MGALQKLFSDNGAHYLEEFGQTMPATQRKVMAAMLACRTPQAGALVCGCAACGQAHLLPRSCGNRHCPSCQGRKAFEWLQHQLERALPTHHFMLTFTVPESLRAFLRSNQRLGYAALFAASAGAIRALAGEPRFKLGDQPGFFGVLHTWGRSFSTTPTSTTSCRAGRSPPRIDSGMPRAPGSFCRCTRCPRSIGRSFARRSSAQGAWPRFPMPCGESPGT